MDIDISLQLQIIHPQLFLIHQLIRKENLSPISYLLSVKPFPARHWDIHYGKLRVLGGLKL